MSLNFENSALDGVTYLSSHSRNWFFYVWSSSLANKMPSTFLEQYFFYLTRYPVVTIVQWSFYNQQHLSLKQMHKKPGRAWCGNRISRYVAWPKSALCKPWLSNFYPTHFPTQTSKVESRRTYTNKRGNKIQFWGTPLSVQFVTFPRLSLCLSNNRRTSGFNWAHDMMHELLLLLCFLPHKPFWMVSLKYMSQV